MLRKKFENSIDREVIESVYNTFDENYNKAHETLMEMLKSTKDQTTTGIENINLENRNGICAKTNNIRYPAKANGSPTKDNRNNNASKTRNPSKREIAITDTVLLIKNSYKVMVLLRGIPGSGKSYLAKQIVQQAYNTSNVGEYIFSADDFFSQSGRYRYVREKISEAHAWNQNRVYWNVRNGLSPIIVDNTSVKIWEMKVYVQMAVEYGYYINILEPATPWAFNHHELAKRNVHDVPREKIRDMLENYDHNVTASKLLSTFGLGYGSDTQPPQQRLRPPIDENSVREGGSFEDVDVEAVEEAREVPTDNTLIDLDSIPLPPSPMSSISRKPILNTENTLTAWGLTENLLNSWGMVQTIQDNVDFNKPSTSFQALLNEIQVICRDSATNTSSHDFAIAQTKILDGNERIISAYSRDITKNISTPVVPPRQRKSGNGVLTFEKGMMTSSDVDNDNDTSEADLATLRTLFSEVPLEYLKDVYEKCHRNTDWVVDLLLDDNRQILTSAGNTSPEMVKVDVDSNSDNESVSAKDYVEIINLDDSSMSGYEPPPKHNKPSVDNIKKHIESMVKISNEFYSDHVLNLRSLREGNSAQFASTSNADKVNSPQDNSDMEIDDFEMEQVMKTVPVAIDCCEDFVELNLGSGLVRQLESQFGDPHLIYPDGLLPTIQVPVSFARQLHALYLESVFEQLENQQAVYEELCKEDEAFATKLQEEENRKLQEMREKQQRQEHVPQLAEIMQEQAAQKDYYQSKLSADDLASRLTRQKLFDNFPSVSEETMLDIFAAHDNNYVKTVEVLLNTGLNMVKADEFPLRPPVEEQVITEMKQAEENLKKNKRQLDLEIVYSADEYRQLAQRHGSRRNELMTRAQEYHRRGMGAVAMFYSRLAREESDLYDQTNARAAECFLQEHNSRHDKFDTIDLHYLQAKEVVPALDIFLDRHINLLHGPTGKRSETLYVITGRGKHSRGGVSVIKPIVMNSLAKRQIGYTLLNPGLLQITVNHNAPITSDLGK